MVDFLRVIRQLRPCPAEGLFAHVIRVMVCCALLVELVLVYFVLIQTYFGFVASAIGFTAVAFITVRRVGLL